MTAIAKDRLYVGVDVGGTNIQAILARARGTVLQRYRVDTPRNAEPSDVVDAIAEAIRCVLAAEGVEAGDLAAVGLAIPGVVDPDNGRIAVTPNLNLTGLEIVAELRDRIDVPVTLGNDVNLGTLGEKWLGGAWHVDSVVGIFVGTGIGGGVLQDGRLHRGCRESAGEIGHLIMQLDGPVCGCGSKGCFEALASRTAIDRDIREAVRTGRPSVIGEFVDLDDETALIRSGALKKALRAEDELVTEVLRRASEIIGMACLSIRHLLDPEAIVFGGGVIEACGTFMLPIIEEVIRADPLTGARPGGKVLISTLGDDAVALGGVALAQQMLGEDPFANAGIAPEAYPHVELTGPAEAVVDGESYTTDVCVHADGTVKAAGKKVRKDLARHRFGRKGITKLCRGNPSVLYLAIGEGSAPELSDKAKLLLHYRDVEFRAAPLREAVEAYNACTERKALLLALGREEESAREGSGQ